MSKLLFWEHSFNDEHTNDLQPYVQFATLDVDLFFLSESNAYELTEKCGRERLTEKHIDRCQHHLIFF